MRFLISEHKAMCKAIESSKMRVEEFTFRKKGGVLFVDHPQMDRPFSFHRKKETLLNEDRNWATTRTYMFDKPSKSDFSTDWSGILFAFDIWLKSLK